MRGARPGKPRRDGDEALSPFRDQRFFVEGLGAIAEHIRFRPESLVEVVCSARDRAPVEQLVRSAPRPIPLREATAAKALARDGSPAGEQPSGGPPVAQVNLKAQPEDVLLGRCRPQGQRHLILVLDHVTDPRNLGAIVRSAAFFGVDQVVVAQRRQVLLTQAGVATAQGGFAHTDLICVVNLVRTLKKLKELGYWVIGMAMDGEPVASLSSEYERVVLVLGSEGEGISHGVRQEVDRLAAIEGRGKGLESLNVAVAAGIALECFSRARDAQA